METNQTNIDNKCWDNNWKDKMQTESYILKQYMHMYGMLKSINTHTYTLVHTHVNTYVHTHTHTRTHTHVHIHVHVPTHSQQSQSESVLYYLVTCLCGRKYFDYRVMVIIWLHCALIVVYWRTNNVSVDITLSSVGNGCVCIPSSSDVSVPSATVPQ